MSSMKDQMEHQMALKIEAISECTRLRARVAELEIQNAGLTDQALRDRREAGELRGLVAIAKQALEAARPILGYHEYEPWRNEMDAQTAKAASLVRHALDRLNP